MHEFWVVGGDCIDFLVLSAPATPIFWLAGEDDELDEDASGGIVAEEPGLGKTLECISTVIMNPAPHRSPVNKRWDAAAKIDVREIKVGNLSWMRSHIAYLLVDHAYRYSALIGAAVGG